MPIIHSGSKKALHENMRTLMHDIGKSPHVQSRKQAIAIALSNARRYGHAAGGGVQQPFGERMAARSLFREGFLHSSVPGRTDKLPITVGGGAYVLPADHIAAIGQGNSLAGANIVNKLFKMGPYGSQAGGISAARSPMPHLGFNNMTKPASAPKPMKQAHGGKSGHGQPTDIIAAGGEIVIPPEKIIERFGDLHRGHKALDAWVVNTRKKHIATLKKLPRPAK